MEDDSSIIRTMDPSREDDAVVLNKKRRLQADPTQSGLPHDDTSSSSDEHIMIKTLQDENKKLRANLASLKDITCRSLRRNLEWDEQTIDTEWVHDSELVAAAVYGGCANWKSLPPSLKRDCNIAIAAIEGAGDFGRSSLEWEDLPEPCRSNPDVILAALKCRGFPSATIWTTIPTEIKQTHKAFALFGVKNFSTEDPDNFPCLLDRAFMREQIHQRKFSWLRLPTDLRTDIEFARSFEIIPSEDAARGILTAFPILSSDRTVWEAALRGVAAHVDWGNWVAVIETFAPPLIFADRGIMLQSIGFYGGIVRLVDASLSSDRAFLMAAVDRNFRVLPYLTHEIQGRFPDIVDHALGRLRVDRDAHYSDFFEFEYVAERLAPEFWDDREFVLRWFEHGFPFVAIEAFQLPAWKNDKEIFLRLAKYCIDSCVWGSFRESSASLRNDKKFMLQVLELRPSLFRLASARLQIDFDLAMLFFSGEEILVQEDVRRRRRMRNDQYIEVFQSEVSAHLNAHRIFSTTVLPAMSLASNEDSHCTLAVLNQGAETSLGYKKLMAEYLGVPIGKQLGLHRKAFRNLSSPMDTNDNMNI